MKKLISYIVSFCLLAILVNYSVRLLVDIWLELVVGSIMSLGFYVAIKLIKHHQDWRQHEKTNSSVVAKYGMDATV